ncbi:PREDICTED: NAC domain-containing protein 82-like [Lupinus angustifolius]|uniref:NAC domain-containing protein 82-like n=1 Tax=Lupinus angustifolius TaxID=3871 RepID=UPI00092EFFBF|nr:PREDICTED: NAC domain-containing protein 82-like [Lupinus angustifolius]
MGRETLLLPSPPTPSTATTAVPPPLLSSASGSTALVVVGSASSVPSPTSLAPGFRFHPTDEELVIYYLKRKVGGKCFRFDAISEVDIYRSEPWDLADKSRLKTRDQEWYFFSALDKKYGNGGRMNRATNKGYWKATGNDRPVRHEQRTVGLKKTLVFHSGRAPDGKRTNWVMHEYRLVDEELEKARTVNGSSQDAFVLCRVFHKNNIGPPNGQRYAPFVEEEWDDESGLVPGAESVEPISVAKQPCVNGNGRVSCIEGRKDVVQDNQSIIKAPFDVNKLPIETQNLLTVCKRESMTEFPSPKKEDSKPMQDDFPSPQSDNHKPFSQIYKRRRYNLNNQLNVSGESIRTSQDPCSSTITTAATTLPTATAITNPTTTNSAPKKHFLSALVEFSLMESLESKEVQPPDFDADNLESTVSPSCLKFIKHLQSEMQKLSIEREAMRFEMMSAQAMINILQSRVDHLNKENEELKMARNR